jgi:hypothetical protein
VLTAALAAVEPLSAALVLVRTSAGPRLLAVVSHPANRLRVSDRVDVLLAVSAGRCPRRWQGVDRALPAPVAPGQPPAPLSGARVRRAVARWYAHAQLRSRCGLARPRGPNGHEEHGTDEAPPLNLTQQRAQRWLRERVGTWSAVVRRQQRDEVREAHACILAARSAACERALHAWMQTATLTAGQAAFNHPHERIVGAWRDHEVLVRAKAAASAAAARTVATPAAARGPVIDACLFVRPPHAPTQR